jgi:hypothetical protein
MSERHGTAHPPSAPPQNVADRRPWLVASIALVGAALIATAVVWLSQESDEDAPARGGVTTTARDPQTEREHVFEVHTALKNGAFAMETYALDHLGDTSGATTARLERDGLTLPAGVALTVESTRAGYCLIATHRQLPDGHPWKTATYDSGNGALAEQNSCP